MNKAMRRIFSLCSCLLVTLSAGISFIQHTEKAQVVEATEYKIDNDGKNVQRIRFMEIVNFQFRLRMLSIMMFICRIY